MIWKSLWSCMTFLVAVSAQGIEICGSSSPPVEARVAARALQASQNAEHVGGMSTRLAGRSATLLIPTYVHIIEATQDVGFVTETMLNDQMRVLNETFAPHNIQFVVQDISHTINDVWAGSTRNKDKSLALRRGNYDDLNLFFESRVGRSPDTITGLCEFPVQDPVNTGINGTSWAVWDGCHVGAATMPGGPGIPGDPGNNQGKTGTHEVGHWFGLFHVFDGFDCNGEGDFVDDTPMMAGASKGCNIGQDTCPDHPGLDPINNYMDYSSNECQHEFTPGQATRMHQTFNTLRKGKKLSI